MDPLWTPGNVLVVAGGLIGLLTPSIISIISAIRTQAGVAAVGKAVDNATDKVKDVSNQVTGVSDKVNVVHDNVKDVDRKVAVVETQSNGKSMSQDREIANLHAEIRSLTAQLAQQENVRSTLASEVASKVAAAIAPPAAVVIEPPVVISPHTDRS